MIVIYFIFSFFLLSLPHFVVYVCMCEGRAWMDSGHTIDKAECRNNEKKDSGQVTPLRQDVT